MCKYEDFLFNYKTENTDNNYNTVNLQYFKEK